MMLINVQSNYSRCGPEELPYYGKSSCSAALSRE